MQFFFIYKIHRYLYIAIGNKCNKLYIPIQFPLTDNLIMARKKKTRQRRSSYVDIFKDERLPKILGILCWIAAVFLSLSFISYFFTWKQDQDKVLKYSWNVLFQGDLEVSNMLGRLGAIISNAFIYWGLGLSSIVFIFLLLKMGIVLIRKRNFSKFIFFAINTIILACLTSIILEFIFNQYAFAFGGSFGASTFIWLTNFIGRIGLLLLLAFIGFSIFIWYVNPALASVDLSTLSVASLKDSMLKVPHQFVAKFKKTNSSKKSITVVEDNDTWDTISHDDQKDSATSDSPKKIDKPALDSVEVVENGKALELQFPDIKISTSKAKHTSDTEDEFEITDTTSNESEVKAAKPVNDHPFDNIASPDKKEFNTHVSLDEPYDPHADLKDYKYPNVELLNDYSELKIEIDKEELKAKKDQIVTTLEHYNIKIDKIRATIGPTVTLYEIVPAPGVKISKIKNLEDDIALSLAALGIRIIAPIPGKGTIGIEVPNKKPQIVALKEILKSDLYQNTSMALPIALGKTISNEVYIADLAKMPHLLIAGATGQGKSVGINTILMSLLYKKHPSELKLILVDPKRVELPIYNDIENHFLAKLPDSAEAIITDTTKVVHTINSLCIEMDNRYELLQKARVRHLKEYNKKFKARKLNPQNGHRFLPYIVLVIDEFADLIMTAGKEVELPIARLAQLARAVGIHLIVATQRPSVKIITGLIKANFPARLAFKVTSNVDSRTILDGKGAEQLIGRGDMLLSVGGTSVVRLQCAFVDTPEVEEVIGSIQQQRSYGTPYLLPEFKADDEDGDNGGLKWNDVDPMFVDAAQIVVGAQSGSTSLIQRKLSLGYNRAGRIMDQLESFNIVGPPRGSKPREVFFFNEMDLMDFIETIRDKN